MTTIKKLGILTSGGDCAGLNAAIRGVVHRARMHYGWEVYGIRDGTSGLSDRPVRADKLELDDVSINMMRQGGTFLGTNNKGYPRDPEAIKKLNEATIEGMKLLGLDALIGIGGDGSFAIMNDLLKGTDIPFVGIPKTIDNDVSKTEFSLGFHTAVAVATEALDRLQPTAASHARVMVLEVMGRDAGHIAIESGIAGGADVILLPEIPWTLESVTRKIEEVRQHGRNFALVVVSEAAKTLNGTSVKKELSGGAQRYGGIGDYVAQAIAGATGAETRVTVLGHVQRGCPPSHTDRLIAQAFGVHAVELLAQGKGGRMVAWNDREVIDVALDEATASNQTVEPNSTMIRTARALGICLGD